MQHQIADKRRVYLACRAIFAGDKAQLRRPKKVREEIVKRPWALGSLTHDLGIEKVVEILRDLLERRVFESELKAKVEFPELFHSSLDQEVQREASEIDAARSAAEALEEIASAEHVDGESEDEFGEDTKNETSEVLCMERDKILFVAKTGFLGVEQTAPKHTVVLPSLYPTYIPYKTQHLILNETQRILEESCFEFVQKWLPTVLSGKEWDCASSMELTGWTRLLAKKADKIPQEALNSGGTPLAEVLFATNKLRHSAVHRLSTSARGIQDLVKSAVTLAFTLGDHKRASQLEEMCYELDSKIKAMELNKNALENSAMAGIEDIQRLRAELDQKEKDTIIDMVKSDQENKRVIGNLLEDSVSRILEGKSESDDEVNKAEQIKEEMRNQYQPQHQPQHQDQQQDQHDTLKYHLLGPSLTKAGQDSVDQSKVSDIIYNASKGSKYFNHEEVKDKVLTQKISQILEKKRRLEKLDLTRELRMADQFITQLEVTRDLTQYIVHVDCDAFYAAVEQLDRPELKDVPFAVGGGVLTTCNYVARKFGCRSGMAGFVAKKLCPDLLLLPLNFEKYTSKAQEVRQVLAKYDPRFESASIDEAYLNITEYCAESNLTPGDVVQQMRDEIHDKTRITVSAGIAANAKLAKICSNMNKPNGQYILPSDRNAVMTFMRDLPTRKVNGIGRVLERELQEIGIKTCGDIYPHRQLLLFGDKTNEFLLMCYLGLGRTDVQPAEEYERKSVGTESTFRDMCSPAQFREKLRWTADELEKDMRRAECKGRTLVLKVKLHTYEVLTRQVVTPRAICTADDLYNHSLPILARLEQDIPGMKLRLMGLRCTHLISTKKPDARAFFRLRPLTTSANSVAPDGIGDQKISEIAQADDLPHDMLEDIPHDNSASGSNGVDELQGSQMNDPRRYEKGVVPIPKRPAPAEEPAEWWDCPVCNRPQPTDERLFNDHIDLCLSRQTIRDTVQRDHVRSSTSTSDTPVPKRLKSGGEKKRSRSSASIDPRQTKLFFG
ncbi:uncharacterized protein GGS22DRAFT_182809 [Annulohypoxylon maeteangense]|uniref:uncharacterized protein n=1 Tax=Annulohypoxylon maeteangense TaxID=1927788 RepID=UPI002007BF34|nr:uncharacterized protein GGS22DRAFT_182809 [Annulohypoxylon maeteangense]KAI0879796.1 hypothetical protein GGS22DRAFT_182809 [Annulohypoxylon maeteangense]